MLRSQKVFEQKPKHSPRGGLLFLGARRELFLVSFAVGLVMTSLWQACLLLNIHLSPQKSDLANGDRMPVMSLAVNPKHLTLFTHAMSGQLSQISLETGAVSFRPVPNNVTSVAMSSQASTIAILEEWAQECRINHRVDVIRDDQIVVSEELKLEPNSDASVYISHDGNVVMSFSNMGKGIGWDLTDSEPRRWSINVGPICHMNCLSPDGRRLFVASRVEPPYLCNSQTGEGKISLVQIERTCFCVAWSADGSRLSIGDHGGGLHVFDTVTGQRIWYQKLNFEFARSVAFSNHGGKLAVGGFDEIIRVWDLSQPDQEPMQFKGQRGVIRCLEFTASDQNLISGSFNGTVFEWSLANQTCSRQIR